MYQLGFKELVNAWVLGGKQSGIFAYGFTGTGKSYSVFGTESDPGLTIHIVDDLLKMVKMTDDMHLRVSFYEVTGNYSYDLLSHDRRKLFVRQDSLNQVHIRREDGGLLLNPLVSRIDKFLELWRIARRSRKVGSSTVHDESSRSHCICDLSIVSYMMIECEEKVEITFKLLVDESNRADDERKSFIMENLAYLNGERQGPMPTLNGVSLMEIQQQLGRPYAHLSQSLENARQS